MSKEKQKIFDEMNAAIARGEDWPIEKLPDSKVKWNKILAKGIEEPGWKYTDEGWNMMTDSKKVLGERIDGIKENMLGFREFKRASDCDGYELFIDGASNRDIRQGLLGDCYLLSAISVMATDATGDTKITNLFKSEREDAEGPDSYELNPFDGNKWKSVGAFLLEFCKDGKPEYIIVDDYLAFGPDDLPLFSKGGPDGNEIWIAILEKAYAKLYGNYSNIEAGQIPMALADLNMGGFPDTVLLKTMQSNTTSFANFLQRQMENGTMLGVGSAESAGGDNDDNGRGIVMNHAYAILQVKEYNDKLLL